MQRLPINDYDLSAITNEVNKWQSHGKFASYDVSKRETGVSVVILENVFAGDGSSAALEIHKLGRKSFFGKKSFWIIQIYKGQSQNGPFEKRGCVTGKMLVGAIMEAERDMKHNFLSVADFDLSFRAMSE